MVTKASENVKYILDLIFYIGDGCPETSVVLDRKSTVDELYNNNPTKAANCATHSRNQEHDTKPNNCIKVQQY